MNRTSVIVIILLVSSCASINSKVDVEADVQMDYLSELLHVATHESKLGLLELDEIIYIQEQSKEAERQILASKRRDDKKRLAKGVRNICNIEIKLKRRTECDE